MDGHFQNYISTEEDRLTYRKWLRGLWIFYGLSGLLIVGCLAAGNYQAETSHNAAATSLAATIIAINNNRSH